MKKILKIAKDVRKKCEDFAMSSESCHFDFHNQPSLDCMCAVASFALYTALKHKNITSKVVYGMFDKTGCHCWVEYRNWIIDITATQFDNVKRPVYVTKKTNKLYEKEQVFRGYNRKFFNKWDTQKPSRKTSYHILRMAG